MKVQLAAFLTLMVAAGCSDSTGQRVITPADVDFDTAVEIIATSHDFDYVNSAQARLAYGGLPAIAELRLHLSDERLIPTGYSTRSINSGDITIGEHALWTIQDMIETTRLPKSLRNYPVLTRENVDSWLDDRSGASLRQLQIEAARTAFIDAQNDFRSSGSSDARAAMELFREQLHELESDRE
ncbi:type 1 periplasmic-binding domain-containing protein [Stieleria varia]|uniref:Uncharacterized protein n=1 Tax=Stieleria varia TaxID=2528005 RepID=A0A5C6AFS9_9BACT|nr:hypothetical protein [Stieleria varia]TWT98276.1 hypothetical protein Pla52n_47860 [Stieleria varia]